MRRVLITGTAGFIGFHLAQLMLDEGFKVIGYDGMTDYYDIELKRRRHQILLQNQNFSCTEGMLEDNALLSEVCDAAQPDIIVHLAGQAGVRYSLENPRSYMESNVMGTFNVIECARRHKVDHLLMASTSSVYGAITEMPFTEVQRADTPLTLYAATKRANEHMGHCYAHLWKIPTTMFRFFTVYGPYGRPDMALFKFVKAGLSGEPINVYGHGQQARDFTYVTDLVRGIRLLVDAPPEQPQTPEEIPSGDSLSPVAPYRVVNIGNGTKVPLMTFIAAIETALGMELKKNFMEMQMGDVHETWADNGLLQDLTGYRPQTDVAEGVQQFVSWYRDYYGV
ncbi:NAD-dependent epimerase/dehydratase family protein [Yoonia litorea]|uniref:UDP-glucuronate 4-epimerase n=1 Tax=Yoonia litorea TaxID=1123755 RepID=A0A1I6MW46_9RHOB|nr:NAD-dependent epimerase/dehydratase family protein [Yoonia litorea]SFS19922.1 UDP-glucuronate 4-epimerase [Yoonia litorea]